MQEDLKKIWDFANKQYSEVNDIYKVLEGEEDVEIIKILREKLGLERDKKVDYALCERVIALKEEPILQILKKRGDNLKESKTLMIKEVSEFYSKVFERIMGYIEDNALLTPLYRTLLSHSHKIGLGFNAWFIKWNEELIEGSNIEIAKRGCEREMRESIDKARGEAWGERSYSVVRFEGERAVFYPYAKAFPQEIGLILSSIKELIEELQKSEEGESGVFCTYFQALCNALAYQEREGLIEAWREVDRAWSEIKAPIQIAHPFEYYEDIYRHSVAPEWDIRLSNPYASHKAELQEGMIEMQKHFTHKLGITFSNEEKIKETLFFDCMPLCFYGSLNNGLFSAQVIPNDESIEKKKIFAYTHRILHSLRAKPQTKLEVEIFPSEFLLSYREILESEERWREVYHLSTNGHEYGHILWVDERSEGLMNEGGEYKNLEEFKATCGGLVRHFYKGGRSRDLLIDHLHRSIKLISYQRVEEVLPYYCEGLLHLSGAFESGILSFEGGGLEVDWSKSEEYVEWYLGVYERLLMHYVEHRESGEFLSEFVEKKEGVYLPLQRGAREFVEHYYERYLKIGGEIL